MGRGSDFRKIDDVFYERPLLKKIFDYKNLLWLGWEGQFPHTKTTCNHDKGGKYEGMWVDDHSDVKNGYDCYVTKSPRYPQPPRILPATHRDLIYAIKSLEINPTPTYISNEYFKFVSLCVRNVAL